MSRLRRLFPPWWPAATSHPPAAAPEPQADPGGHTDAPDPVEHEWSAAHAALAERLDRLLGEVGKLGREQFRATTLLEGQGTTLEELVEDWREERDRRQEEAAELHRLVAELGGQARLGLVKDLLPVADALDASVRAARELLAERPVAASAAPRRPSLLERLRGEPAALVAASTAPGGLASWLDGLLLIERRLLALLEREGVRPIAAVGQPFDPHRHLAVAVTHAGGVPDGIVVGEELRGYTLGERVLRHAEVIVARGGNGSGARGAGSGERD